MAARTEKPRQGRQATDPELADVANLAKGDRWIIGAQRAFASFLIVVGAFVAVIFPDAETIGTAIIGAGAALLPVGAAASASARIHNRR